MRRVEIKRRSPLSFHFTFAARTIHEARSKLHGVYAPGAVKALVEKALEAVAELPQRPDECGFIGGRTTTPSTQPPPNAPPLIGIFVEVWGHFADAGDRSTSEIQRFIVKPLFV